MLDEGERAPDFTLDRTTGGSCTLSQTLEDGPAVVILNRGVWCSYCAEQLQTFSHLEYDLWRNYDTTILPVMSEPVPELVEMRTRFGLSLHLLSDPTLSLAESYTAVEDTTRHGRIPVAGTFIVDSDGIVQYAQVASNPADRTYANFVRHVIRNDFERPYG